MCIRDRLWSIIRLPIWKFWNFREKKTPNRPNYFLDFPIMGPKKKVVVNFIYGYQKLWGEKCKSNGKRISSIRHTSEEKNPKNHPKIPLSEIWKAASSCHRCNLKLLQLQLNGLERSVGLFLFWIFYLFDLYSIKSVSQVFSQINFSR